jgi:CRISPR-associated protein Csh1
MILDLLDVYGENAAGDTLVIDNYQLKEGLYIKLYGSHQEPEPLKVEKKLTYNGPLWEFFKTADFYSQLVDMNKPIDPKKQIHSNNLYAVTFKAALLTEGADARGKFRDSVKRYYEALRLPKKEDTTMLASYQFPPVDVEHSRENEEYVLSLIDYLEEQITVQKIKANIYVKLYFQAELDNYIRESKRYLIPKIFNNNYYNVTVEEGLYGLSNSNMGMNAKKPFLEHKTAPFKAPFRVSVETALAARNLFIWLNGQKDEQGKAMTSGYLPVGCDNVYALERTNSLCRNAHYLHIEKGTQPVIDDYDFLPGLKDKFEPLLCFSDFLLLDDFEAKLVHTKADLESIVDDLFFNKNLVRNYYEKSPKPNDYFSAFQAGLLVRYKDALLNYFRKGSDDGFINCLERLTREMLKEMLLRERHRMLEDTKIAKALNLRLSLFQYFNVKERANMGDRLRSLAEGLKGKLMQDRSDNEDGGNIYCESEEEFFYYVGQLVRYQISKSQAYHPNYDIINHVMEAKNVDRLKEEIRKLHIKYSHALRLNHSRYNKILSAVMAYQCPNDAITNSFDLFLAGLASPNMIYNKSRNENEGGTNNANEE